MSLVSEIVAYLNQLGVTTGSNEAKLVDYIDQINSGDIVATVELDGVKYIIMRVDINGNKIDVQSLHTGEVTEIPYDPNLNIELVDSDG